MGANGSVKAKEIGPDGRYLLTQDRQRAREESREERKETTIPHTPRGSKPPNKNALKHGLNVLRATINTIGNRVIDKRTVTGKALDMWRRDLITDLGGDVSTQQAALVELCVRSKLLLDSVDAWLLSRDTLIVSKRKALIPALVQRTQLAHTLERHLLALGLERRSKVETWQEILDKDDTPANTNGTADDDGSK